MTQLPSPVAFDRVAFDRHIRFDGPGNFRDLGGYAVAGGSQVRWRTVFRSDGLETVSPRDREFMVEELRVGVVVDLRSPREAEQYGTFPAGPGLEGVVVRLCPLPILDDTSAVVEQVRAARAGSDFRMADLLTHMIESCSDRFVRALQVVAEAEGPVVFHCAAGKDRTGLLAALLLGVLGADEADILEDYGYSRRAVPLLRERWQRRVGAATTGMTTGMAGAAGLTTAPTPGSAPAPTTLGATPPVLVADVVTSELAEELLSAEPAALAEALGFVRARHGSIEQWATDHGASGADLQRLRGRLLEPAGQPADTPRGLRPRTPSPSGELALAPPGGSTRSARLTAD